MTVNEAKKKIHWHVRDADSVRPEPYSSPAAARCAMQIRGEPMPGFWVKKIGLRGACPCRQASSVAVESGRGKQAPWSSGRPHADSRHGRVSSDRKVQTPRKEGEPRTKQQKGTIHTTAGAANLSTSVNPTSYDPSVAPATISEGAGCAEAQPSQPRALLASAPTQSTYGQAELSYLNALSGGGYEG